MTYKRWDYYSEQLRLHVQPSCHHLLGHTWCPLSHELVDRGRDAGAGVIAADDGYDVERRRCTFDNHDCTMLGRGPGAFCAIHDRIACPCGHRLLQGVEKHCPQCGRDVRLQNRLTP